MSATVPHALAAAGDLVACDVHRATLPALAWRVLYARATGGAA